MLIEIKTHHDIPYEYRHNPIGLLLEYHNLRRCFDKHSNAKLLIGTCIDYRISLRLPSNFAFIIRTAGCNMQLVDFNVSFVVSVGNIQHIALIGHNDCGMVNLFSLKDRVISGLVKAGWSKGKAEEHFTQNTQKYEIKNEIDFILSETERMKLLYPGVLTAPLMYSINTRKLSIIKEK